MAIKMQTSFTISWVCKRLLEINLKIFTLWIDKFWQLCMMKNGIISIVLKLNFLCTNMHTITVLASKSIYP